MNYLGELIGTKVIVSTYGDDGDVIEFGATVIDVEINDWYFHDKGEPIYITVNVAPIGELPSGVDEYDLHGIPLKNIIKYNG